MYSRHLNNTGLNYACPLICKYFSINIQSALRSAGFTSANSANHGSKTVFFIRGWELAVVYVCIVLCCFIEGA